MCFLYNFLFIYILHRNHLMFLLLLLDNHFYPSHQINVLKIKIKKHILCPPILDMYLRQRSDESSPEDVSSLHVVYDIAIRSQNNYNVPLDNFMGVLMISPCLAAYEYWRKIKFHGHSDPSAGRRGRRERGWRRSVNIRRGKEGKGVHDQAHPPCN